MFYYHELDRKIHDLIYKSSTERWAPGILSNQNYTAMPNSSLTAVYYQCTHCANAIIISYQDQNGFVQIANYTSAGWTLSQLGPDLDPLSGTGLALLQYRDPSLQDHINLFHQKSNLNMSVAWWRPKSSGDKSSSIPIPISRIVPLILMNRCWLEPQGKCLRCHPKRRTHCRCGIIFQFLLGLSYMGRSFNY